MTPLEATVVVVVDFVAAVVHIGFKLCYGQQSLIGASWGHCCCCFYFVIVVVLIVVVVVNVVVNVIVVVLFVVTDNILFNCCWVSVVLVGVGGWPCKVIFVSNPTSVLRVCCRWGCDNLKNSVLFCKCLRKEISDFYEIKCFS